MIKKVQEIIDPFKQRWNSLSESRKTFVLTFVITYVIATFMCLVSIGIQFDNLISFEKGTETVVNKSEEPSVPFNSEETQKNEVNDEEIYENYSVRKTLNGKLTFYNINGLSVFLFIFAKLTEILVGTTVTFCATILCLQTNVKNDTDRNNFVKLVVVLLILCFVSLAQIMVRTQMFLWLFTIVVFSLCIFCIIEAKNVFWIPELKETQHKNENSDGSFIGVW